MQPGAQFFFIATGCLFFHSLSYVKFDQPTIKIMGYPATSFSFQTSYSFSVTAEDHSFFSTRPLSSSRVEIVCVEEGAGIFIAGDERAPFTSGDVFMTGTQLCCQYKLDPVYTGEKRDRVRVSVVRFLPDLWGETFINLYENGHIKVLLENANCGIMANAGVRETIGDLMERMHSAAGGGRIVLLLEMLFRMSDPSGVRRVCSGQEGLHSDEVDRLERVHQFSRENFSRRIGLEEIAAVAYVSPNSFCRWFKSRTTKTFSRYVIELRVRHACRLLIESRHCVKRICVESGFNNFSNFHKCFKEVMGKSPMEYQRAMRI
jgi:AraC-like DNA-binding protein